MLNNLKKCCGRPAKISRGGLLLAAAMLLMAFQPACFSKKSRTEAVATSPVRLVLLPFNVGANKDLHWASLAAPVLMAKAGEDAKDLEIVPLWQTMPVALTSAGPSRMFTQESAVNVGGWLSAKWCVLGELTPTKNGVSMVVDFIPTRSSLIPFRYAKSGKIDSVGAGFNDAYAQFLRYLVARPPEPVRMTETMTSMKGVAEALDREYGWYVEAEPGKSQDAVDELMRSNDRLARFLFSPSLYPSLAQKK